MIEFSAAPVPPAMWREDAMDGLWLPTRLHKSKITFCGHRSSKERFIVVDYGLERSLRMVVDRQRALTERLSVLQEEQRRIEQQDIPTSANISIFNSRLPHCTRASDTLNPPKAVQSGMLTKQSQHAPKQSALVGQLNRITFQRSTHRLWGAGAAWRGVSRFMGMSKPKPSNHSGGCTVNWPDENMRERYDKKSTLNEIDLKIDTRMARLNKNKEEVKNLQLMYAELEAILFVAMDQTLSPDLYDAIAALTDSWNCAKKLTDQYTSIPPEVNCLALGIRRQVITFDEVASKLQIMEDLYEGELSKKTETDKPEPTPSMEKNQNVYNVASWTPTKIASPTFEKNTSTDSTFEVPLVPVSILNRCRSGSSRGSLSTDFDSFENESGDENERTDSTFTVTNVRAYCLERNQRHCQQQCLKCLDAGCSYPNKIGRIVDIFSGASTGVGSTGTKVGTPQLRSFSVPIAQSQSRSGGLVGISTHFNQSLDHSNGTSVGLLSKGSLGMSHNNDSAVEQKEEEVFGRMCRNGAGGTLEMLKETAKKLELVNGVRSKRERDEKIISDDDELRIIHTSSIRESESSNSSTSKSTMTEGFVNPFEKMGKSAPEGIDGECIITTPIILSAENLERVESEKSELKGGQNQRGYEQFQTDKSSTFKDELCSSSLSKLEIVSDHVIDLLIIGFYEDSMDKKIEGLIEILMGAGMGREEAWRRGLSRLKIFLDRETMKISELDQVNLDQVKLD